MLVRWGEGTSGNCPTSATCQTVPQVIETYANSSVRAFFWSFFVLQRQSISMASAPSHNTKGTILLTGANGSLGSTIASQIVSQPELAAYHGLYAVRDANTAHSLATALHAGKYTGSHTYDTLSLDLTDLASVRAFAASINTRVAAGEIPALRAIILNAGYLEFTSQSWTKDGFDTSFVSNYLGHWLLTLLLLQSLDKQDGRMVIVGSESHDPFNSKSQTSFNDSKWMTFMPEDTCDPIAYGTWSVSAQDPTFHRSVLTYPLFCSECLRMFTCLRRLPTRNCAWTVDSSRHSFNRHVNPLL